MSCKSWWRRGDDDLTGTPGNDRLSGGRGNDTIDGDDGNDFIWAGRGRDVVDGGDGDDWLGGGRGNDILNGGLGNDWISGGRGRDTIDGGDGNDWISGGRGSDVIAGGDGNDWISGGRGRDTIDGGDGDDHIHGGRGRDTLNGGAGNDTIYAGSGSDTVTHSTAANDGSKDYYHGGRGKDVLILQMTHADYESSAVQADLKAFDAFLAQPGKGWKHQSFQFEAFDLKVESFERYEIQYVEAARSLPPVPANAAPVAQNDTVLVDVTTDPIQEIEPNDPNGIPLSTSAQVIERSSFRVAPNSDLGDQTLPWVSIHGTISGSIPIFGPAANDVDLYAITLEAGEKLILDIDHAFVTGSQMNAQLFLMDASGNVVLDSGGNPVENDNAPTDAGGAGSTSVFDPYLEYTDPGSGGTYYVAVSAFNNDPDGTGFFNDGGIMPGDYVLNVSIDNAAIDLGAFVISADTLLSNDSDADNDPLVITSVGNAVNGTVQLTSTGEILFRPASPSPGTFDYTVSDGNGGEATATVTVNGNPILGTAGNDVLTSTTDNDLIVTGEGNDTVNFATGSGNDTIADFTPGVDRLAITDSMTVADIAAQGNDTLVAFDTGDSALLIGVSGVNDVSELFGT